MSEPTTEKIARPVGRDIDTEALKNELAQARGVITAVKAKVQAYWDDVEQIFQDSFSESDLEEESEAERDEVGNVLDSLDNADSELADAIRYLDKTVDGNFFAERTDAINELYEELAEE